MKNAEYYIKLPYKLEIVPDTEENGYVVSYPELPGCISCGEQSTNCLLIQLLENLSFAR